MYFTQQRSISLLGSLENCYHIPVSLLMELMLQSATRGILALTFDSHKPSYNNHFAKKSKERKLLKMFPKRIEALASRSLYGDDKMQNGCVLSIRPLRCGGFITEIIIDEKSSPSHSRLELHVPNKYEKPWVISIPIVMLMNKFKLDDNLHCGYCHGVYNNIKTLPYTYAGITKRNWLTRASEHFREAENGSKKKFHQHWLSTFKNASTLSYSEIAVVNKDYDDIMDWEEEVVDVLMKENRALNMIPGGKKGINFLHEHRMLAGKKPLLGMILMRRLGCLVCLGCLPPTL